MGFFAVLHKLGIIGIMIYFFFLEEYILHQKLFLSIVKTMLLFF